MGFRTSPPRQSTTGLSMARGRGFTLLEMLVVLVLMSFVTVLVSQMLTQVARIERLLNSAQLEGAITSVRVSWVKAAIESMLPMTRESGARFVGDSRQIAGMSSEPPVMPAAGLTKVGMSMVFEATRGVTEFRLLLGRGAEPDGLGGNPPGVASPVLFSWPGNTGRFRFLDTKGLWHDSWPIEPSDADLLPVAVMIETGLDEVPRVIASIAAAPQPLPSRQSLGDL